MDGFPSLSFYISQAGCRQKRTHLNTLDSQLAAQVMKFFDSIVKLFISGHANGST